MLCGWAGFEPKTLGIKAERYDHCATRPVSPTEPRLLISWLRIASQGPYCWLDSADLIMKITFEHAQVCAAQKRPSVRVLVF
jgi:hypothetical protein